jgi:hypothetical protein
MKDFKTTNIQIKIVQVYQSHLILHKVHNNIEIHWSLKHKVIINQVHTKVAEANSFKTIQTRLIQIQCQVIVMFNKSIR